jgi:hypothetical protein
LREEKRTFVKVEGGKVDFFLYLRCCWSRDRIRRVLSIFIFRILMRSKPHLLSCGKRIAALLQVERRAVSHSAERELCVVAQALLGSYRESIRYND